ncbi:hypothetical protein [Lentzea sp. NPDC092896]|uniref:hypothetical protein n=1 Tax=Lentzea sp. NPDC092896 TaxID=3364127 RepID=UPI003816F3EF
MSPADVAKSSLDILSLRFFVVSFLPTFAGTWFLLTLVWAGAPGNRIDFGTAWATTAKLGAGQVLLIVLAVVLVSLLLTPVQLAAVRLLEGRWPRWPRAAGRWWQLRRKKRLQALAEPAEFDEGTQPAPEAVLRAAEAGELLSRRFPHDDHLVRATALGNALTAMEDTAGRVYGFDAVVAWPRLYVVLGDRMRAIVDDRRDVLDSSARTAVTGAFVAVVSAALLLRSGPWLLLTLAPAAIGVLAYSGARRAAESYAEAVRAAFDLHRFDLIGSLHLPLPATPADEVTVNKALCDLWRQGVPFEDPYHHPGQADK